MFWVCWCLWLAKRIIKQLGIQDVVSVGMCGTLYKNLWYYNKKNSKCSKVKSNCNSWQFIGKSFVNGNLSIKWIRHSVWNDTICARMAHNNRILDFVEFRSAKNQSILEVEYVEKLVHQPCSLRCELLPCPIYVSPTLSLLSKQPCTWTKFIDVFVLMVSRFELK